MKKLLAIFLLFTCGVVDAAHIGKVQIKRIRVYSDFAIVQTHQKMETPTCAAKSYYFLLPLDESHASNRKFSALLAAHAQQKYVDPNCSACDGGRTYLGEITQCDEISIE